MMAAGPSKVPPLGEAVPAVLERARTAGVARIVVPAYDLASWAPVRDLASRFPDVIVAALGLHPWAAAELLDLSDLEAGLRACGAVAVGEIGLDSKVEAPSLSSRFRSSNGSLPWPATSICR